MESNTDICAFCGGEIIFRLIRGVTTPIHTIGDSDCIGRRLYRRDQEGVPHYVQCPKCGACVIFLRHNGGCVWLEALGVPWPKHPCFDEKQCRDSSPVISGAVAKLKNAGFYYAMSIGRLKSRKGIVLFFGLTKRQLQRNPKYEVHMQYVIPCHSSELDDTEQHFHGPVGIFVSFIDYRLVTPDGTEFDFTKYFPKYPS